MHPISLLQSTVEGSAAPRSPMFNPEGDFVAGESSDYFPEDPRRTRDTEYYVFIVEGEGYTPQCVEGGAVY